MDLTTFVAALVCAVAAWTVGFWYGDRRAARRGALAGLAASAERQRTVAQTADRLRRSEERLDGLLGVVEAAVIALDASLDVTAANARAQEWFAIAPASRPSLMTAIRSAELRAVVDDARRGNTESQPVRIGDRLFAARAVVLQGGETILALTDRTLLEYLERARRDLVANVSHDLRTPLTSLGLLLDSLDARVDPAARPLLAEMAGQIGRIRDLADDLLQLNELDSGRALFRLVPESVQELVDAARASMARLMADGDVDVHTDIPASLRVLADRGHIVRALVNLLDNARRFSPAGTTIRVDAAEEPASGDVQICVSDEGPGIPPRDRVRIFERFYRGDRARRGEGTGLGLAIAKHIVEGHGGRIWATDAAGGGASVCFTLLGAADAAMGDGAEGYPRQDSNLRPAD